MIRHIFFHAFWLKSLPFTLVYQIKESFLFLVIWWTHQYIHPRVDFRLLLHLGLMILRLNWERRFCVRGEFHSYPLSWISLIIKEFISRNQIFSAKACIEISLFFQTARAIYLKFFLQCSELLYLQTPYGGSQMICQH